MPRISYLNNEFINHDEAFIHIEDRGFQFSDSVYEVIYFHQNKLIDAKPHLDRLFRSLDKLSIAHNFLQDDLTKTILDLFKKNNLNNGYVYLQISRGSTNRVPFLPQNLSPTIVATVSENKIFTQTEFDQGLSLMSHQDIRWQNCDIKTTSLLASTLLNQKARDAGFNDALLVRDNFVTEASFSNFFMVDDGDNLITKDADNFILEGITRNRIIDLAKKNGINVIEKKFSLEEAKNAKEAFLSSSTLMIRPVSKIDNCFIGDKSVGKITKKLSNLYKEFLLC